MTEKCNPSVLMNEAPTVIGMMSVVLTSGGSFETAVRDVSENGPPGMKKIFSEAVRDADCRLGPDIAENVKKILSKLPKEATPFRRSMDLMITAFESSDVKVREEMMKDAEESVLKGLKEIGDAYSSGLSSPCMMIFGLGIMLPMILVSILPMLGLGGQFAVSSIDSNLLSLVILVFIPLIVASVILYLKSKNPFLKSEGGMKDLIYIAPLAVSVPMFFLLEKTGFSVSDRIAGSALIGGIICLMTMAPRIISETKRHKECDMLSDAIFELGNRLSMGENYDIALTKTFSSRKDMSRISEMTERELAICRGDVRGAVSSVLSPISEVLSGFYCDIYDASTKDIRDAGRLALSIAHQLRDQESVRKDIGNKLKSMLDMMTGTAAIFAPLILAMSMVMLGPISKITGTVFFEDMSVILTVYLIELTALIAVLSSNLTCKGSMLDMEMRFCAMMPISMAVFALCSRLSI